MTLYTSPTCAKCPAVKKYLTMLGAKYEEKDISDPDVYQEMYDKAGVMTVPVVVEGNRIVIGQNYAALRNLCITLDKLQA